MKEKPISRPLETKCAELHRRVEELDGRLVARTEKEERFLENRDQLASLAKIFQMIDAPVDEIVQFTLSEVASRTDSPYVRLILLNDNGDTSGCYAYDNFEPMEEFPPDKVCDRPEVRRAIVEKGPVIGSNAGPISTGRDRVTDEAKSIRNIVAPIFGEVGIWAIIEIRGKNRDYTESDALLVNMLADGMRRLVENRRTSDTLKQALKASEKRLTEKIALCQVSKMVLENESFVDSAGKIFRIFLNTVLARVGYLIFLDHVTEKPLYLAFELESKEPTGAEGPFEAPVEIMNLDNDSCAAIDAAPWFSKLTDDGDRLLQPIEVNGRNVLILGVWGKPNGFTQSDERLAKSFGEQLAIAWQGRKTRQDLLESELNFKNLYNTAKRMREVYESLLNATPDGVLVYEIKHGTTYLNPAFTNIFGYNIHEVKNLQLKDMLDVGSPLEINQWFETRFHESVSRSETSGLTKGGNRIDLALSSSGFVNSEFKIEGIVFIISDITKSKLLQEQLYHAQKQEALGLLAGGIAHDFNNILSGIMGYTELTISSMQMENKNKHFLGQVLTASKRAADLVAQILAFSRHTEMVLAPINVIPIFKETIKLLRATLPTTIDIICNINCKRDVILANPTNIQQVLMNLCTNAAHSMKASGGNLYLELNNYLAEQSLVDVDGLGIPPGLYLHLFIKDSGCGIPPEILERIFEPYFTTKSQGEGTGLGLAVVQGIVDKHNGKLIVRSRVNHGTEINIYLPLKEKAQTEITTIAHEATGGKESILVVDDEEPLAKLIVSFLQKIGYKVEWKTNPVEALETFRNAPESFDLIITDQTMPKMTGLGLVRSIHDIRRGFPVIICTGDRESISNADLENLVIDNLVNKPFTLNHLAEVVRRTIDAAIATAKEVEFDC